MLAVPVFAELDSLSSSACMELVDLHLRQRGDLLYSLVHLAHRSDLTPREGILLPSQTSSTVPSHAHSTGVFTLPLDSMIKQHREDCERERERESSTGMRTKLLVYDVQCGDAELLVYALSWGDGDPQLLQASPTG